MRKSHSCDILVLSLALFLPVVSHGLAPTTHQPPQPHPLSTVVPPLPTETPEPTITETPQPTRTAIPPPDYESHHQASVRARWKAPQVIYGGRARVWLGDPHLRWQMVSYGAVWVYGPRTGHIDPPPNVYTTTPAATQQGLAARSSATPNGPQQAVSPTPSPTATFDGPVACADRTWLEAGFKRAAAWSPSVPECYMYISYTFCPGVPSGFAGIVQPGRVYEIDIHRSDITGTPPPQDPNSASSPSWTVDVWSLSSTTRLLLTHKSNLRPGMAVADEVIAGGEVWNYWRNNPQPPPYLNDMGRHGFSRIAALRYVPGTAAHWTRISALIPSSVYEFKNVNVPTPQIYHPQWSNRYFARLNSGSGSGRYVAVDGFNQKPFNGTDRPCTCGDGNVICVPPPGNPRPGPDWPFP